MLKIAWSPYITTEISTLATASLIDKDECEFNTRLPRLRLDPEYPLYFLTHMCLSLGYMWNPARYVTYKVSSKSSTLPTDSQYSRVLSPSVFLQTWQTLPHGKPALRHYTHSLLQTSSKFISGYMHLRQSTLFHLDGT